MVADVISHQWISEVTETHGDEIGSYPIEQRIHLAHETGHNRQQSRQKDYAEDDVVKHIETCMQLHKVSKLFCRERHLLSTKKGEVNAYIFKVQDS
jgi:hypothetical protein